MNHEETHTHAGRGTLGLVQFNHVVYLLIKTECLEMANQCRKNEQVNIFTNAT